MKEDYDRVIATGEPFVRDGQEPITKNELENSAFQLYRDERISERKLREAFVLLKRAQGIFKIFCRHGVPDEIRLVLDRARNLANEEGKPMGDLVKKWEENRMCNELIFNFGELEALYSKLGMDYALRRSDKIL